MSDQVAPIAGEISPDEIVSRSFPTVRRGLDAEAVRSFLVDLAAQLRAARAREMHARSELSELETRLAAAERRAAAPELDEATLTAALGTETAKVLRAAHDAAREVVAKAESRATELTGAAQEIVAKQSALAQEEADRIVRAARAEAESLTSAAREECRQMVEEAREARRRILTDLADRRRHLHVQLEQIRAAKDALEEIVDRTAASVEGIRRQLTGSEDAARQAAEGAAGLAGALLADQVPIEQLVRDVLAGPAPVEVAEAAADGELASPTETAGGAAALARVEEVGAPPEPFAEAAVEASVSTAPGEEGEPAVAELDAAGLAAIESAEGRNESLEGELEGETLAGEMLGGEPSEEDDVEGAEAPTPGDEEFAPALGAGEEEHEPSAVLVEHHEEGPASEAELTEAGEPKPDEGAVAGPAAVEVPPVATAMASEVDELFARIRASRAQEVAEAREVLDEGEHEAVAEQEAAAPDGADLQEEEEEHGEGEGGLAARRDALVAPAIAEVSRALKRMLRSQQNELLAATRSSSGEALDALLPAGDVAEEIVRGARPHLTNAYLVGIEFAADVLSESSAEPVTRIEPQVSVVEAAVDPVVRRLAEEVVGRIVEQLGAPGDDEDPARQVGTAFREWKGERVDQVARDAADLAFALGILELSRQLEAMVSWDLAGADQPCAECDDNALAERQRPGTPFPTGHLSPPAHSGCRCVVVPSPS